MVTLTALTDELQSRCDALTNSSTVSEVIDQAIAAKSAELAGETIDRTILDVQIQRIVDLSGGSSAIEDLISLTAANRQSQNNSSTEVGSYIAGLFAGNPKYLACNGGTYLRSAYPDLSDLMLAGLSQQVSISASESTNAAHSVAYETQTSVYKVGSKYYKLLGGYSTTSGWQIVPIQYSYDGVNFLQVAAPSMASPITSYSASFQMDSMLANGVTLVVFGRMQCNGANYVIQLRSQDDGKTWIFSTIRGATSSYNSQTSPVMAVAIGNTVIAHVMGEQANTVCYSANFCGSWGTLSDTDVVNTKYINGLAEDGARFMVGFSDGSSAYSATDNPSGATWTAVAPPNASARGVLAVVSGKWIMGGASGYVATATTAGTWVAESTCTSGMPTLNIERILISGTTIAFSSLPESSQVFYCTDASTLPAATAVVVDTVASNPTKLSLASVADGNFYIRQAGNNLIRSATLVAGSFSSAQVGLEVDGSGNFDSVHYGTVKKFGLYFYSVGGIGRNKRFVSTDMKNWRLAPSEISTGCGAVVDAGTRLLALDDNMLLWQSTDGESWSATGITRPTLTGTPYSNYARLFVCANGWVYFVAFRNSDTSYYTFVSKNDGSTWSAVSGLSFAGSSSYVNVLQNPCLFKEINGKIYSLSVNYFSSNYGYYLSSSFDGISFTYITGASNAIGGVSYSRRNGIFEVGGVIYAFVSGDTSVWLASYDDGIIFSAVPASFVPSSISSLAPSTAYMLVNYLSADDFICLRKSAPETLVRLSGAGLAASANYAAGEANTSPAFFYESGAIKMLAPAKYNTAPIAPKLISLADSNMTFTLPNITNTWLRAAA